MQYHFKSIDTWLKGICRSHCPEHHWKRSKYQPGKKSIFVEDQSNETPDEDAEQEDEVDDQAQNNDGDEKKFQCGSSGISGSGKKGRHDGAIDKEENQNAVKHSTVSRTLNKPIATSNTVPLQDISCSDNNVTTNLTSVSQRTFHNVDECVHWLLSKITFDLENELSECELQNSSYSADNETVEFPFDNHRTVELSLAAFPRNSCSCPQCCHREINCIHQDNFEDEGEFGTLEDCKEFSTSLECFDSVYSDTVGSEVVSINQCPNNSNGGGSSRRSVCPSKAKRKGKGESRRIRCG